MIWKPRLKNKLTRFTLLSKISTRAESLFWTGSKWLSEFEANFMYFIYWAIDLKTDEHCKIGLIQYVNNSFESSAKKINKNFLYKIEKSFNHLL